MKNSLLIIFLFFSFSIVAQEKGAILALQSNSFDFGRILEDNGVVQHKFLFTNTGSEPLMVTNVRTTCGCTVPSWTKDPVQPGKEGYVEIEFNPRNHPGTFHKTVQVQSSAQNSNMFLTISGTVIPPMKMENLPNKLGELNVKSNHINLGYLYKGETGIENMIIANNTKIPIEVGFKNIPDYLSLIPDPPVLNPGEYGQVEVQYNTTKINDWDVVIDQIPVEINGKEDKKAQLTITANIREDFRNLTEEQMAIAPVASYKEESFDYDTITSDKPVDCQFLIRNEGQSDLIIRAVKPTCGCTAVKPKKSTLTPGDSTYIDAVFYPKGRTGEFKNGITIITNDPRLYKKYLYLEGYIKK